jgi:hypothetical protein
MPSPGVTIDSVNIFTNTVTDIIPKMVDSYMGDIETSEDKI